MYSGWLTIGCSAEGRVPGSGGHLEQGNPEVCERIAAVALRRASRTSWRASTPSPDDQPDVAAHWNVIETAAGRAGLSDAIAGSRRQGQAIQPRRALVDTRDKSVRDRAQEAERYRDAAELALDQLQWCINYLYRIQRPTLARQLERNREHIQAQL